MRVKVYIIGAVGLGREISATLNHPELQKRYTLRGFVDDKFPPGEEVNGTPISRDIEWLKNQENANVILGIGNPEVRQKILERLSEAAINFPTVIHPGASIYDKNHVHIGKRCFIAQNTILTTNTRIGDFCFINTACTIHYDTVIGDHCVLGPGKHLTGGDKIGDGEILP